MMKKTLIVLGAHLVTLLVLSPGPSTYAQLAPMIQNVTIQGEMTRTVDESSDLTYTFTRPATTAAQSFTYSVNFNTASAADFTSATNGTITFQANSGEATLVISTARDTIIEGEERCTVTFTSTNGTRFKFAGSTANQTTLVSTIIITDDDSTTISLLLGTTTATEGTDDTVSLRASLTANEFATQVGVTLGVTANSTAAVRTDYTLPTITIAAGRRSSNAATIAIVDDVVVEQDEIVEIYIVSFELGSGIQGAVTNGTPMDRPVTLTIISEDTAKVRLMFGTTGTAVTANEGTNVTLTAFFPTNNRVDADVILFLGVIMNRAAASPDIDYTLSQTITITANEMTGNTTIAILDDDVVERDEVVRIYIGVLMTAVNDGLPIGVNPRVTNETPMNSPIALTINSTDFATVSLSLGMATATEGTDATVTATLDKLVAGEVSLTLAATADSTATSVEDSRDYTLNDITIAANTNEGTATIDYRQ